MGNGTSGNPGDLELFNCHGYGLRAVPEVIDAASRNTSADSIHAPSRGPARVGILGHTWMCLYRGRHASTMSVKDHGLH